MNDETRFQTRVLKVLRDIPNTWVCKISQKTISGTPDLLCCINGTFVAIELKKDAKSNPTQLQIYELNRISKAKGRSYLCHPGNWIHILKELLEIASGALTK